MNKTTIMNNVVPHETIRKIQQDVLDKLSMILKQSFGPMGSNTVIKKENALNVYTKDGHTILSNIYFHGIIEQSIKDDIETITRHIVTTVGDGTTSGVMMSAFIYRAINEISDKFNLPPVQTLEYFNDIVNSICTRIKKKAQDCTLDDIYDICMISTNGNEFISEVIRDIYKDYGNEVFIDVAAGIDENTAIKAYDGMTINTGFVDPCFVTDTSKNECVIDTPSIYFFSDPIDTKEMAVMLDAILSKNIVAPYNEIARGNAGSIVPTVIVAPKISRDLSSLMNKIIQLMNQLPAGEKLPLLIITDYHQIDEVEDIAKLCNAPFIHKYIDPKILEEDVEAGLAPTPDTIETFCGHCEQIVSSSFKTSFINPIDMKNEDGSYTTTYNNLLSFLETSLSKAKENGEDAHAIGTLKRRIHSLRSNLVEVSVGGISPTDRDALRDLVEDAVKNCRSAAANGVGYAANFMGFDASASELADRLKTSEMNDNDPKDIIFTTIASAIYGAYGNITNELYSTIVGTSEEIEKFARESLDRGYPYNIRTRSWDGKVVSSIESDIVVLQTVSKIIGLMATSNQFIVPSPMHNVYVDD